jgi:UDP-N-acetylmuramate dehydrogenase
MSNEIQKKLKGLKKDEILAPYTSFKIGGPAKYFFVAKSNKEIIKAVEIARQQNINLFILGSGSNVLVADHGFDGLVIKMESDNIFFNNEIVKAESGIKLQKMIREIITRNLTGLEFLIGIPGTVGGGVAGNVGTPNEWINKNLIKVEVLDADSKLVIIPKSQCDFSYRSSRFKNNNDEVILSAEFQLEAAKQDEIQAKVKEFLDKRSHQTVNEACAGSVFKNPEGKKAWELIEEAGLRGKQIGGAKISEQHTNFIINTGRAKAEDVVILISLIKQQVRNKFGIQLQEEIKYIGF